MVRSMREMGFASAMSLAVLMALSYSALSWEEWAGWLGEGGSVAGWVKETLGE